MHSSVRCNAQPIIYDYYSVHYCPVWISGNKVFHERDFTFGEKNTQSWKELTYFSNLVSYTSLIGYTKFETKNSSFSS